MDLRALEEPQPLEIRSITDIHVLTGWEYWLKLSYFTADLHIVRAWSLNSRVTEISFDAQARALRGAIVYSFLDPDRMQTPQSFDEVLKGRRFSCDWKKQIFPTGALEAPACFSACPTNTFKVLLCKLATGSTLAHQESEGDFATRDIPGDYTSLVLIEASPATNETKMSRMLYRVKKDDQVLPSFILEFAFQSILIEVSQPMCEVCDMLPATLFCPADRAHLCDECDELHHSSTRLLARHKRLPVTHSPFQFGQCPTHPSEMLDCVCMVCFMSLCPHCILIGSHAAADFSEHPLISTLDAYKMSMQSTSPSEEALKLRTEKIMQDLHGNHRLLSRLHANFASVHSKIDSSNKVLMTQLQNLKQKQVGFLQAVKRELLTECLIVEWMEAFFAHLRLTLCPSDYVSYQHRHDLLAADLFGGTMRIEVGLEVLPPWVAEKLFIEGSFRVTTAPFAIPELRMSEVAEDSLLRVFLTGIDKTRKSKLRIKDAKDTPYAGDKSSDGDTDDGDSDEDCDMSAAEWAALRGTADEVAPGPRVDALSRVLLFGDEPATKGLASEKQQEIVEQEGETCVRAETDKDKLPPQILEALEEREREETENLFPTDGLTDPLNTLPKELVKQLWRIASDLNFHPLCIILKAAEQQRLPELMRNVCTISCYMKDVENFLKHLIQFELDWVAHLPEGLFLSTSSLCGPLFDSLVLHSRDLLKQEDRQWMFTLIGPPLRAVTLALGKEKQEGEAEGAPPEDLVYAPLKSLVDCLTGSDFLQVPSSIRAILYIVTDAIDSEGGKLLKGGLSRVPGAPPHPTNSVSGLAVSTCVQIILGRFLGSSLHLLRKEALAPAKKTGKSHKLALEVPFNEAGRSTEEAANAQVQKLFWDRRSLDSIAVLDKALRQLASFSFDPAVSALMLEEHKHTRIKEEEQTEAVLKDIKERLETHPDHRFYAQLATRMTSWMRRQLELPRLHSPIVLASKKQPEAGEAAARSFLEYIRDFDSELRNGKPKLAAGLVPEDIYSPHFEQLASLALKASAYPLQKTSVY